MSWLTLALRYRKYIAALAVVFVIAGAVVSYGRARYNEGVAHVRAQWSADTKARDAETARVAQEYAARTAATVARNDEVLNGYQDEISRIAADRDSVARRLREYKIRERSLSAAADKPGAVGAGAEPKGEAAADGALDAYDSACRRDAAQLDALIRQVRGQLDKPADL